MKKLSVVTLAKILAHLASERMTQEKEGMVVREFIALLSRQGMLSKSGAIIALAEDYLLQKKGHRVVVIETPRAVSRPQEKLIKSFLKTGDKVSYKINADLVAGMKVTVNNEKQFDFSLKKKLEEIFK